MTPRALGVFKTPNLASMTSTDGEEVKKHCIVVAKVCPL